MRNRWTNTVVAGSCTLILSLGWPGRPAAAHAALKSANPADGAVLAAPPESIELVFNEKLQSDYSTVRVSASGGPLSVPAPTTSGTTVTQILPAGLSPATYTVIYRVVSADGHPISGKVSFTTRSRPSSAPPATTAPTVVAEQPAVSLDNPGRSGWAVPAGAAVLVVLAGGAIVLARRRRPRD